MNRAVCMSERMVALGRNQDHGIAETYDAYYAASTFSFYCHMSYEQARGVYNSGSECL